MQLGAGVFPGKLQVPPVLPGGVVRPRLDRLLTGAVRAGPVIVCAPAGSGKTHLLAEWASSAVADGAEAAWVTVDERDRDPTRFLRYVIEAIGSTPAGQQALSRLSRVRAPVEPDDSYLPAVQSAMNELRRNVVLILDDFHHVIGSPAEQLLRRIARFRPERVRLVVLSRVEPGLGQHRLRVQGRVAEIGAADLALTVGEVRALFVADGLTPTDAQVQRIHDQTGGWAAVVRLLAAAWGARPDAADDRDDVTTGITEISDYLTAEVFEDQPPHMRAFMLRTCVVDRLCVGLARALTSTPDGHEKVTALRRAGLLLDTSDGEVGWLVWNPTLVGVLRRHLRERDPQLEQQMHLRAAHWLHRRGDAVSAVRQALCANDVGTATALLRTCWLEALAAGELPELMDLLVGFPADAALSHADLAVVRAFMGARDGDLESALRLARHAVELAGGFSVTHKRQIGVQAAIVRLYVATITGQLRDDAERTAVALIDELASLEVPLSRRERISRALLLYNLGAFETSRQQYGLAEGHLRAALDEARLLTMPYLELSCHAQLVEHDMQAGRLSSAENHAREVLDAARSRGWHSRHGLTAAHVNLAGVALLRDDLGGVFGHLADARRIVRRADRVNRFRVAHASMLALCAAGRVTEAAAELDWLDEQVTRPEAPSWMVLMMDDAKARRDECRGRPDEALLRVERTPARPGSAWTALAHEVLHAELLLRCGRAADSRRVLAGCSDAARNSRLAAEVLVLAALAAEALESHAEALALLDEALTVASAERLIRPFVTPGPQLRPLLEELLDRGTSHQPLVLEILEHGRPDHSHRPVSGRSLSYVEPLTARELDVLHQLPSTLTNSELAEKLYVSVNTLRTHMKRIDRKLGASGRRDAVRRARQLGIL